MNILVACDCFVRPHMLGQIKELEKYGNQITIFDNPELSDVDSVTDCMLRTELNGAEAVDANEEFVKLAEHADIIVVHITPVGRKVIEAASKLKLVAVMRGGCDSVNVELLHKKKITVVNAPWRSSYAVADFTVGMMISEVKNIAKSHHLLMKGKWEKRYPNSDHYIDMRNRTIGLIGFGYIGRLVAENLSGFGSNVIVHDPFMKDEQVKDLGGSPVSLEKLLEEADIVSLHLRYSDRTKHFLGKEQFEMMKPTATLVNTARAGLVDQEALVNALESHQILGAAVDVFSQEPLPKDNPYRKLDNITITPHIAGTSRDTMSNAVEIVSEDLHRYFEKTPLKCEV